MLAATDGPATGPEPHRDRPHLRDHAERQIQDLFTQHDLTAMDQSRVRAMFQSLWTSLYAPQVPTAHDRPLAGQ